MTLTPDFLQSAASIPLGHRVLIGVHWVVKERQGGLWVPVHDFHNLLTNYGLTAYAQAAGGNYLAPTYMVIDTASVGFYAPGNVGDGSVQLNGDPTISGDTQLVLGAGLPSQETVTFTSKSGTNPVIFNLSGTLANAHAIGDPVVRNVTASDTMASVLSEAQYDPTNNPNGRSPIAASYSPATGQGTMQYFFAGITATNLFFAHVGLADQQLIGNPATNLHNYAVLGYNHNNTNDLEIDVTYTLQTF